MPAGLKLGSIQGLINRETSFDGKPIPPEIPLSHVQIDREGKIEALSAASARIGGRDHGGV